MRPATRLLSTSAVRCPYHILSVTRASSDSEIKAAWRRKVLQNHPDHSPNDPQASTRFASIQWAYTELTKAKQQQYSFERARQAAAEARAREREQAERINREAEEAFLRELQCPLYVSTPITMTGPIDSELTGKVSTARISAKQQQHLSRYRIAFLHAHMPHAHAACSRRTEPPGTPS